MPAKAGYAHQRRTDILGEQRCHRPDRHGYGQGAYPENQTAVVRDSADNIRFLRNYVGSPSCIWRFTDLCRLRDVSSLMKVKAFVFRSRSTDAAAVYYDMQRLGYFIFAQNTTFVSGTKAEAGRYVNLIVRRSKKRYHPVMILDF